MSAVRLLLTTAALTLALATAATAQPADDAGPAPAADDPQEEARRLTEQGTRAWERGDHEAALAYFRLAYKVYPSPNLHYDLALAHEGLGQELEAAAAFEAFLRGAPDAPEPARDYAAARLEALDRRLGRMEITCNLPDATVTLDGQPAPLRRSIRVAPGVHTLVVTRAGYRSFLLDAPIAPGRSLTQHVELEPIDLTPAEPAAAGGPLAPPSRSPAREPPLTRRWWFWGAVGAVAAGAVTAFVLLSDEGGGGCAASDLGCVELVP